MPPKVSTPKLSPQAKDDKLIGDQCVYWHNEFNKFIKKEAKRPHPDGRFSFTFQDINRQYFDTWIQSRPYNVISTVSNGTDITVSLEYCQKAPILTSEQLAKKVAAYQALNKNQSLYPLLSFGK